MRTNSHITSFKSRKEIPQKLTQLSSRSHPRHLVGNRTAQKDTIIDITSDSQVNSNTPYRWSKLVCKSRLSFHDLTSGRNYTSGRHFPKYDCGNIEYQIECDIKIQIPHPTLKTKRDRKTLTDSALFYIHKLTSYS